MLYLERKTFVFGPQSIVLHFFKGCSDSLAPPSSPFLCWWKSWKLSRRPGHNHHYMHQRGWRDPLPRLHPDMHLWQRAYGRTKVRLWTILTGFCINLFYFRMGLRRRGRSRHKGRSISQHGSHLPSSSDLSSPNETCYSFVRKAIQVQRRGVSDGKCLKQNWCNLVGLDKILNQLVLILMALEHCWDVLKKVL